MKLNSRFKFKFVKFFISFRTPERVSVPFTVILLKNRSSSKDFNCFYWWSPPERVIAPSLCILLAYKLIPNFSNFGNFANRVYKCTASSCCNHIIYKFNIPLVCIQQGLSLEISIIFIQRLGKGWLILFRLSLYGSMRPLIHSVLVV